MQDISTANDEPIARASVYRASTVLDKRKNFKNNVYRGVIAGLIVLVIVLTALLIAALAGSFQDDPVPLAETIGEGELSLLEVSEDPDNDGQLLLVNGTYTEPYGDKFHVVCDSRDVTTPHVLVANEGLSDGFEYWGYDDYQLLHFLEGDTWWAFTEDAGSVQLNGTTAIRIYADIPEGAVLENNDDGSRMAIPMSHWLSASKVSLALPEISAKLAVQGYTGENSESLLTLHMLAMHAVKVPYLADRVPEEHEEIIATVNFALNIREHVGVLPKTRAEMDAYEVSHPHLKNIHMPDEDTQANVVAPFQSPFTRELQGSCSTQPYEHCDNKCFGRCGRGCSCWKWVCGDCNCWKNCETHDNYCSCYKWHSNCLAMWKFRNCQCGPRQYP